MNENKSKMHVTADEALILLSEGKPLENLLITGLVDLTHAYIDVDFKNELILRNCEIENFCAWGVSFEETVLLENCMFYKFTFDSCFFQKNFEIKDCIFENDIIIGHHQNTSDFIAEGNLFKGKVRFFDYWFGGKVIVKNNEFQKGTSLLGNKGKPYVNVFKSEIIIEDNKGELGADTELDFK